MPDYFVPQDTVAYSPFYSEIVRKSLLNKFSYKYVDSNRDRLSDFDNLETLLSYLDNDNVVEKFISFAADNQVRRPSDVDSGAIGQIRRAILASIIYNTLEMQDYIKYVNIDDSTVKEAVRLLTEISTL